MTIKAVLDRSRRPSFARRAASHLLPHASFWLGGLAVFVVNMSWVWLNPRFSIDPAFLLNMSVVLVTPLALVYAEWRAPHFDRVFAALFRFFVVMLYVSLFWQQINLFNQLVMSTGVPLADERLMGWDNALGLDWNAYVSAVASLAWHRHLLFFAYDQLIGLAVVLIIAISIWRGRDDRVNELAFLTLAGALVTLAVAPFFPAEAAWRTIAAPQTLALIGGYPDQEWNEHFSALRGEGPVVFALGNSHGLATFPSYHTCLALVILWCSRGSWIGLFAGLVCAVAIIAATPVYGAHYLVDLIGGAAVTAGVILLWRRIESRGAVGISSIWWNVQDLPPEKGG